MTWIFLVGGSFWIDIPGGVGGFERDLWEEKGKFNFQRSRVCGIRHV